MEMFCLVNVLSRRSNWIMFFLGGGLNIDKPLTQASKRLKELTFAESITDRSQNKCARDFEVLQWHDMCIA